MADLRENAISLMSITTSIDATAVATTELYEVPPDKTFIPMFVVIRVTALTTAVGEDELRDWAVASFGGNSATYDDFLDSVTYRVGVADEFLVDRPDDLTRLAIQEEGDSFRISIEEASDATVETWAVDLFGYLV